MILECFLCPEKQYMYIIQCRFFGNHSPNDYMYMVRGFSGKQVISRQLRPKIQKWIVYACGELCYVYCRYGQAQAPGPWQQQPSYQAPPPVTPKVGASSGMFLHIPVCFTNNSRLTFCMKSREKIFIFKKLFSFNETLVFADCNLPF